MPAPAALELLPDHAEARGGPLLLGYSGGLDSSALLHRLAGDASVRDRGLRAIHVHHGLHAQADAWQAHCARTCAGLGIALQVARVTVDRGSGLGPEAAARDARHAAFAQALADGETLVLAHHRDDQAETFLLRAMRGAGVDGLGAMRARRRFAPGFLWRPLLDTPRAALLAYARRHGLDWIEDPSNDDTAHDRNHLRHVLLPRLRQRWPQADAILADGATLQRTAADLLGAEDAAALASVRTVDPHCLSLDRLRALPAARRARVLRRWTAMLALPPWPARALDTIERTLLADARGDGAAFEWRHARLHRWHGLLWAGPTAPPLPPAWRARWDGTAPLALPDGGALSLLPAPHRAPPARPMQVHARAGGERIRLPGRRHSHALKHVLQDLGVPPWERTRLPLLSDADGTLLAAGDLVLSETFDAALRNDGRRLRWTPPAA